jgi:signal transduction histidine kinase
MASRNNGLHGFWVRRLFRLPHLGARSLWRHQAPPSPQEIRRTERWLATARLFLAISALAAVWLDPDEIRSEWAYSLLAFYIAQGMAVMLLLRLWQQSTPAFRWVVHGADVIWPALVSRLTTTQSNSFFLFFFFVLAAAACRWGLWETLLTSVVSVALLWLDSFSLREAIMHAVNTGFSHQRLAILRAGTQDFEPKRMFMRSVYLIVMGLFLGYLAERQKRLRAEKQIAARLLGRVRMDAGLAGTLAEIVGEVLKVYGARRALIASSESASTRLSVGLVELRKGIAQLEWIDPGPCAREIYLPSLSVVSCYAIRLRSPNRFRLLGLDASGAPLRSTHAVGFQDLAEVHRFQSLAAASFSFGQELSGRIYLLDPEFTLDSQEQLHFLEELVRQLSPAVYNLYLLRRLRRRAGALERARLVRELHDGAVQSLLGVELQLDVLRRQHCDGALLGRELERIQRLLREEVLKLRELIEQSKAADIDARRLPTFLRDMVERFQRETGIHAQFQVEGEEIVLSPSVCRELGRIAQEALVNVRKHSGARQVMVELSEDQGTWRLAIEDDGRGFAFSGRISEAELDTCGQAPAVIRERVRLIQGELTIESIPGRGSRIEIRVPEVQAVVT